MSWGNCLGENGPHQTPYFTTLKKFKTLYLLTGVLKRLVQLYLFAEYWHDAVMICSLISEFYVE